MRFVAQLIGDRDVPPEEWFIEGSEDDHQSLMDFIRLCFTLHALEDCDYIFYRVVDGAWYTCGRWIANQKTLDTSDAF